MCNDFYSSLNMQFLERQKIIRNNRYQDLKIRHKILIEKRKQKIAKNSINLHLGIPCREKTNFTATLKTPKVENTRTAEMSFDSLSSFDSNSNISQTSSSAYETEVIQEQVNDFNLSDPIRRREADKKQTVWQFDDGNIDLEIGKIELEMKYIKVDGPASKKPIDFILDRFALSTDILTSIIKMLETTLDQVVDEFIKKLNEKIEATYDEEKIRKYYRFKQV